MKKTFVKESITDELSLKMIDTAKQKALEIGKPSVIAIVDESGILKAFLRMDGAPLAAGATTGIDRLVIFGGGFPIKINGKTIGGIGVSGGHYTEDMEVAEAALKVIEGE